MKTIDLDEATLTPRIQSIINRELKAVDIGIIFGAAGTWWLFFAMLLFTGLKVVDVAMLSHWNFLPHRGILRRFERRSGRFSELLLPFQVVAKIPRGRLPSEPLFPTLYTDVDDSLLFEEEMHRNLAEPLRFMQALLAAADRPAASLFSLTLTNRYLLRDRDQFDPDYLEMRIAIASVLENTGAPPVLN
ncbi:MAG: hypothetical protein IH972_02900 [Candidatus Marinimicrobia bacterium]|nr:hypothetical protein [Candidatus Neomarinimicrobiota bacterium]